MMYSAMVLSLVVVAYLAWDLIQEHRRLQARAVRIVDKKRSLRDDRWQR